MGTPTLTVVAIFLALMSVSSNVLETTTQTPPSLGLESKRPLSLTRKVAVQAKDGISLELLKMKLLNLQTMASGLLGQISDQTDPIEVPSRWLSLTLAFLEQVAQQLEDQIVMDTYTRLEKNDINVEKGVALGTGFSSRQNGAHWKSMIGSNHFKITPARPRAARQASLRCRSEVVRTGRTSYLGGRSSIDYNSRRSSTGRDSTDYNSRRSNTSRDSTDYNSRRSSTGRDSTDYSSRRSSTSRDSTDYSSRRSSTGRDSTDYYSRRSSTGRDSTDYNPRRSSTGRDSTDYYSRRSSTGRDSTDYYPRRSSTGRDSTHTTTPEEAIQVETAQTTTPGEAAQVEIAQTTTPAELAQYVAQARL